MSIALSADFDDLSLPEQQAILEKLLTARSLIQERERIDKEEFLRRYPTPGALALDLLPKTRQTPALEAVDRELVALRDAPADRGRTMIFVPPQEGKALALNTPIPTPSGWSTMGELKVGDRVLDRHGKPCRVTWLSPIWRDRPCFTVRTGDGEAIVADAAHEWPARLVRGGPEYLHPTTSLARARAKNAQILGPAGLDLPDADLALDPYTLGAWLGDGHSRAARMTFADTEIADRIRDAGIEIRKVEGQRYLWSLTPESHLSSKPGPVRVLLQQLGVWGDKHIPAAYLRGSDKQRLALLQGLIDTDGYVSPKGQVEFTSTRRRLAEGVRELVYSLGAKATIAEGRAVVNGKDCGPKWRVKFYLSGAAHITRKAERCKNSSVARVRYVSAEPTASVPTRCIEVDSADHTYLAGRTMLPTHNSTRTSCWFPLWMLAQDPTLRIAIVSYSATKAERWGRWLRRMIQSHGHRWGLELRSDSRAVDRFETTAGGSVVSVGISGGISGEPVDLMIIDDPVRGRAEAESPTYRDAAWDWWESNGATRGSARFKVVLMLTRWHADDLGGRLLKHEPGRWRVLRIPAVRDPAAPVVRGDDGASVYSPNGELISVQDRRPGYFLELKQTRSSYVWASIYMQTPVLAQGNLFRRDDARFWSEAPADRTRHDQLGGRRVVVGEIIKYVSDMTRFITMDLAASKKTSADWTVASCWAISLEGELLLLDRHRARLGEEEHWDLVRPMTALWACPTVYVERGFIGTVLVRDATMAGIRILPLDVDTDKITRAIPATQRMKSHTTYFPQDAEWLDEWLDELAEFPSGTHDDQVDTFGHAARVASTHWTPPPNDPPPDAWETLARQREQVEERAYTSATGVEGGIDIARADW